MKESRLEVINISECNIETLNIDLFPISVKNLTLMQIGIRELPASFEKLKNLRELSLMRTRLKSKPCQITNIIIKGVGLVSV